MSASDIEGAAEGHRLIPTGPARVDPSAAEPATRPPPTPEPPPAPSEARPGDAPPEQRAASPDGRAIPVTVERVDALVRLVGESAAAHLRIGRLLAERFGVDPVGIDEYRDLGRLLGELQDTAMRARTVALASVAGPLQRTARDIARASGKRIRWSLSGEATELDRHVLERLREPLVALVRNAVDHGIETPDERRAAGKPPEGEIRVEARRAGAEVLLTVVDDGRGVDPGRVAAATGRSDLTTSEALEAILEPGVSTAAEVTGVSGRGVGLDAVRDAVRAVHGRLAIDSAPGAGTRVTLAVPLTVAVLPCLLLEAAGRRWAVPLRAAVSAHPAGRVPSDPEGNPLGVAGLADVLGLAGAQPAEGPALALTSSAGTHAFRVDAIAGERDVVVKDLGGVVPRSPLVSGAAVDPDGSILVVLDPAGLVKVARGLAAGTPAPAVRTLRRPGSRTGGSVLVVDDALTVRELQRSILQRAGYETRVAADGAEALRMLRDHRADVVVTDVDMPIMDGVALTAAIRATPGLERTPVIVLSAREAESERRRALAAGADEFLVKSAFEEKSMLDAVARRLPAPGLRP